MGELNKFLIPKITIAWENVAKALCYQANIVATINRKYSSIPKKYYRELLKDWLKTNNGVGPKIWSTLLDKLGEVDKIIASAREEIIKDLEAAKTPQSSAVLSVPHLTNKVFLLSKWL